MDNQQKKLIGSGASKEEAPVRKLTKFVKSCLESDDEVFLPRAPKLRSGNNLLSIGGLATILRDQGHPTTSKGKTWRSEASSLKIPRSLQYFIYYCNSDAHLSYKKMVCKINEFKAMMDDIDRNQTQKGWLKIIMNRLTMMAMEMAEARTGYKKALGRWTSQESESSIDDSNLSIPDAENRNLGEAACSNSSNLSGVNISLDERATSSENVGHDNDDFIFGERSNDTKVLHKCGSTLMGPPHGSDYEVINEVHTSVREEETPVSNIKNKNVIFKNKPCETCDGYGYAKICPTCNGDKKETTATSWIRDRDLMTCRTCSGVGRTDFCILCNGTGDAIVRLQSETSSWNGEEIKVYSFTPRIQEKQIDVSFANS